MPSVAQKEATKRWRVNNKESYDAKKKIYLKEYMRQYMKERYAYKKEAAIFRLILIDV